MPLNVPVLDDRTYADLVREGIELIPRSAPAWTNHNASDPGITLLELFAYLTEIYLYRVDRVPEASKAKFHKLLLGHDVPAPAEGRDHQLQQAVATMRQPFRAVTEADFERLAMEAVRAGAQGAAVARTHVCARRNLESSADSDRERDRPNHVSVVFVPANPLIPASDVQAISKTIAAYLEPRRLLTCRVHVVPPRYVDATIRIRAALAPWQSRERVEAKIRIAVAQFFDARGGGPSRSGWPLGRSVYLTDLYRRLGSVDGVSRLVAVEWALDDSNRLLKSETGEVIGMLLKTAELPRVRVGEVTCDVRPSAS